ncbi:MAG TPA: hypothetical protein CFH81_00480 [Sulfurovum sp. UBA12169]|nr:MAG TPA: hypothetical protein CFH81_00480 [Sulfurovum sp. UBA12169]
MLNETTTIGAKALAASTSAGMIGVGFLDNINVELIILGLIGLVVSILSYHYDIEHTEDKAHSMSEIIKYILFGTLALPSAYVAAGEHITNDVSGRLFIGVFASYYIIRLLDTIIQKVQNMIMEWRR